MDYDLFMGYEIPMKLVSDGFHVENFMTYNFHLLFMYYEFYLILHDAVLMTNFMGY